MDHIGVPAQCMVSNANVQVHPAEMLALDTLLDHRYVSASVTFAKHTCHHGNAKSDMAISAEPGQSGTLQS